MEDYPQVLWILVDISKAFISVTYSELRPQFRHREVGEIRQKIIKEIKNQNFDFILIQISYPKLLAFLEVGRKEIKRN